MCPQAQFASGRKAAILMDSRPLFAGRCRHARARNTTGPGAPEAPGACREVLAAAATHYQGSVVETVKTMRPSLFATSSVIFWSPLASVPVYFSASEKLLKS
jgi:hypothetical protein